MKRKNIDTGDVVGSIDYYVLKSGLVFVTSYSIEANKEEFDTEEFIKLQFTGEQIEIAPDADVWS